MARSVARVVAGCCSRTTPRRYQRSRPGSCPLAKPTSRPTTAAGGWLSRSLLHSPTSSSPRQTRCSFRHPLQSTREIVLSVLTVFYWWSVHIRDRDLSCPPDLTAGPFLSLILSQIIKRCFISILHRECGCPNGHLLWFCRSGRSLAFPAA